MSGLDGRSVLITGAGSGIGRSLALALLASGASVGACGRSLKRLESLRDEAGAMASRLVIGSVDVRANDDVRDFAANMALSVGAPDTLIANAGMGIFRSIEQLSQEEFDRVIDINLHGVFRSVQAVLPAMLERERGDILVVGSLASKNGFAGGAAYAAAKFAVRGMAQSMMLDLRSRGIRVMTIFPGSVDTPFFDDVDMTPNREKILKAEDVTAAALAMLQADPRAMISEVDIRPSNPR